MPNRPSVPRSASTAVDYPAHNPPGAFSVQAADYTTSYEPKGAGTLGVCLQNSGGRVVVDGVDPLSPNSAAVRAHCHSLLFTPLHVPSPPSCPFHSLPCPRHCPPLPFTILPSTALHDPHLHAPSPPVRSSGALAAARLCVSRLRCVEPVAGVQPRAPPLLTAGVWARCAAGAKRRRNCGRKWDECTRPSSLCPQAASRRASRHGHAPHRYGTSPHMSAPAQSPMPSRPLTFARECQCCVQRARRIWPSSVTSRRNRAAWECQPTSRAGSSMIYSVPRLSRSGCRRTSWSSGITGMGSRCRLRVPGPGPG